jgi:hypothetical protein
MDEGMEEEQCFEKALEDIDGVVSPADVPDFVKEDGTELVRGHLIGKRFRQKNCGMEDSYGYGGGDPRRGAKLN